MPRDEISNVVVRFSLGPGLRIWEPGIYYHGFQVLGGVCFDGEITRTREYLCVGILLIAEK